MAYTEDSGDITFAFTGDAMPTRRISVHGEPEFLAVAELLRGADVSIANSETLYHQFEGYPVADSGLYGTYVTTHPDVIDDLRWLGLDMVSTANNHCVDYGEARAARQPGQPRRARHAVRGNRPVADRGGPPALPADRRAARWRWWRSPSPCRPVTTGRARRAARSRHGRARTCCGTAVAHEVPPVTPSVAARPGRGPAASAATSGATATR